jgi:RNA polymerase sigma factor (sigma-70 family)
MNPFPCPSADEDPDQTYLAIVVRTAQRIAARRYGIVAADDIVQAVAEQFWPRRVSIMPRYSPETFAAVAVRSRAEELRRSERIQRAEGARLVEGPDGLKRAGREVVQLEAHVDAGGSLPHAGGDVADVAQRAVDNVTAREALDLLDERDRRLVLLVDGLGLTVSEAAEAVGLSRAYANRQLTRIRAELREAVSAA